MITGNVVPDHATIARFICRHEAALAGLFGEVLRLCDQAGLVKPGLIAIDGTRMAGNASPDASLKFEQITREMLAEHKATDESEDERFNQARGDELPERLRTAEGRREFFRPAKRKLAGTEDRWDDPAPVSRSRSERLLLAAERLEADLDVERRANEAYEACRAQGRMRDGRRFGRPPNPHELPDVPDRKAGRSPHSTC